MAPTRPSRDGVPDLSLALSEQAPSQPPSPPTLPTKNPSRQASIHRIRPRQPSPPTISPTSPASQRNFKPGNSSVRQDVVAIKNLQLPFGVMAPDVWAKAKEQPALVSITLLLRDTGFDYAAQNDVIVPGATIHYGELAKRVRAACKSGMTASVFLKTVKDIVAEMGSQLNESTQSIRGLNLVSRATVELNLPKAAMFGSGITLIDTSGFDEATSTRIKSAQRVFVVNEVKVMTLVGVHAYERTAKQPIVASLWLYLTSTAPVWDSEQLTPLYSAEQMLAQIIQDTTFDTLETLAEFIIAELQTRLLGQICPGAHIQLRLEKPRAIAFADAPAIEVLRRIPGGRQASRPSSRYGVIPPQQFTETVENKSPVAAPRLTIHKPYTSSV